MSYVPKIFRRKESFKKKSLKKMFDNQQWKILRGDTVKVRTGKDRGQVGTVLKVIRDIKIPRVVVSGINLREKKTDKTESQPGGTVHIEAPIHYSNVSVVDPVTKAAIRVAYQFNEDGKKVRVTRGKWASGCEIPRPEILKERRTPRPITGPKDTPRSIVDEVTYKPGDWPSFLLPPPPRRPLPQSVVDSLKKRRYSTLQNMGTARYLDPGYRLQSTGQTLLVSACGFAALTMC